MAVKKIYDNINSLGPQDVTPKDPDRRPDWNETDPEAPSYIRNKPGSDEDGGGDEEVPEDPEEVPLPNVNLNRMTKLQLESYAADQGIEGVDSSMTKAQMIEAIEQV